MGRISVDKVRMSETAGEPLIWGPPPAELPDPAANGHWFQALLPVKRREGTWALVQVREPTEGSGNLDEMLKRAKSTVSNLKYSVGEENRRKAAAARRRIANVPDGLWEFSSAPVSGPGSARFARGSVGIWARYLGPEEEPQTEPETDDTLIPAFGD